LAEHILESVLMGHFVSILYKDSLGILLATQVHINSYSHKISTSHIQATEEHICRVLKYLFITWWQNTCHLKILHC